jgi:hypothetical protein
MIRSAWRVEGGVRRTLAGFGLLALACVLAWAPATARAESSALNQDSTTLWPATAAAASPAVASPAPDEAAVAEVPEKTFTLKLDPVLYAETEKATESKGDAAKPELPACPPGVHTPPPLPLFNVEGMPGTLLVPMAYPINCESPGTDIGMPTVGYTFVKAGTKTVQEAHLSETFYRRFEVGYTLGTLDLGDFPRDVRRATHVDIGFQHVVVHNFNLSAKVLDEGPYNPAIMAAATFKYNPDVKTIDRRLGGAVSGLGLAKSNSVDYTLTATKTVIDPLFNRPLILTGGIRFSEAAQLGYLGFGDTYRMTGEGSVVYLVKDWLAIAYEYRQKKNPYHTLGKLVGPEDAWQAVDVGFIITPNLTFAVGWLCAGNVANGRVDNGWGFQLKYEF